MNLKVLYSNKKEFYQKYGNLFLVKHPNISIEVVELDAYYKQGLSKDKLQELVDLEQPDLLFGFDLQSYIDDEKLINLDPYLAHSNKIKVDQMNRHVINFIRNKGGGKLYALSPTFQAKAIYYNQTMFQQFGVDEPVDYMTWDDVIQRSARFPKSNIKGDSIYGFYYNSDHPFWLAKEIAETSNLSYTDAEGKHVLIHSESWKKIFDRVILNYNNSAIGFNTLNKEGSPNPLSNNIFSQGRAAMTVDYSYRLNHFANLDFGLGIVTAPVHPSSPSEGDSISPNQLFGINAASRNVEAAWKLLEFINSEDFAVMSKNAGFDGSLSIYEGNARYNGMNIEAFYKLGPKDRFNDPVPYKFLTKFEEHIKNEMTSVIDGNQDLDKMLARLEKTGQFELDTALKE